MNEELSILGVANQDSKTFPLNRIKNLTASDHFKKRANQRFGITSQQSLAWAKHLLKSAEYDGDNVSHSCSQYKYKQVIFVVDLQTDTLVTVMSNIYQKALKDDNLSILLAIQELPNSISKPVINALYKATNAHLRDTLAKLSKDALKLSQSMQIASKTSQPQLLRTKYQKIIKQTNQIMDSLNDLESLNKFGGLSHNQINSKAKFYHTISSDQFKVGDYND